MTTTLEIIEINEQRALELLREVVEGKEDFVYVTPDGLPAGSEGASCQYVDVKRDCPSCMIGHVLFKAGATLAELAEVNSSTIGSVVHGWPVLDGRGHWTRRLHITDGALDILTEAQREQDAGRTWGAALARAEAAAVRIASREG